MASANLPIFHGTYFQASCTHQSFYEQIILDLLHEKLELKISSIGSSLFELGQKDKGIIYEATLINSENHCNQRFITVKQKYEVRPENIDSFFTKIQFSALKRRAETPKYQDSNRFLSVLFHYGLKSVHY